MRTPSSLLVCSVALHIASVVAQLYTSTETDGGLVGIITGSLTDLSTTTLDQTVTNPAGSVETLEVVVLFDDSTTITATTIVLGGPSSTHTRPTPVPVAGSNSAAPLGSTMQTSMSTASAAVATTASTMAPTTTTTTAAFTPSTTPVSSASTGNGSPFSNTNTAARTTAAWLVGGACVLVAAAGWM